MPNSSPVKLPVALQRRLGLPLLVLYGTGITIGAGIYVLIGAVAGRAGIYAPWSFVIAATGAHRCLLCQIVHSISGECWRSSICNLLLGLQSAGHFWP